VVRDLAESGEVEHLVLLDAAGDRLEQVAVDHGLGRASIAVVDARDAAPLARILGGSGVTVLVNAAFYRTNLAAMEAALAAGCDYVDLGGMYHTTMRQLGMHDRFAAAGRCAVLGIGASPGTTNLLAVVAAGQLDKVHALHVAAGATDPTPPGHTGVVAPYAIETILDQLTMPAVVLRNGAVGAIQPLTDGGDVEYPEPIGTRESVYALHSELATFPTTFPDLQDASFRLSLAPMVADRIELLVRCGLADVDPLELPNGSSVAPRTVLLAALDRAKAAAPPARPTTAAQVVEASGVRRRRTVTVRATATTVPHQRWGLSGGVVAAASPAAEATRRLLVGDVTRAGVLAPEQAFTPDRFLQALSRVNTTITVE